MVKQHAQVYADPSEVERQAAQWESEVLECRTYGHIWQPARATFNRRQGFYYVVQRCPRCTSERHMELGTTGHVYASWIVYAEGYLSKGLGRIVGDGRDVLRLAAVLRTFPLTTARGKAADVRPHSRATREALGWSA